MTALHRRGPSAAGQKHAVGPIPVWKRRALGAGVRGALVVIGLAPLWVTLVRDVESLKWIVTLSDSWFTLQCHLAPARRLRSPWLDWAVCARCTGIYLGLALGALVARPPLSVRSLHVWLGLACAAMLVDVATERWGWRASSAALRVLVGISMAYPVAIGVLQIAKGRAGDS